MLRALRTGFKYFTYGLLVGLFLSPRPGDETRQQVLGWIGGVVNGLLDTVLGASSQAPGNGSPAAPDGSAPQAQGGGATGGVAR